MSRDSNQDHKPKHPLKSTAQLATQLTTKLLSLISKTPVVYYRIFFSILAALIISSFKFDIIELYLFDLRTLIKAELGLSEVKDPKIALVYIDLKTIEKHNGYPSFNDHTLFLEKLAQFKNSQIIYNFRQDAHQFIEIHGPYDEKANFAKSAKKIEQAYFLTEEWALKGQESALRLGIPLQDLKLKSGPRTNDSKFNAKNAISRRIILNYEGQPLIHQEISALYNPDIKNITNIQGTFEHVGTEQIYTTFRPAGTFPTYNFDDVLENKIPAGALENKIIIVGSHTNKYIEDYVATPYSYETADLITTSELHANMFQTLISNDAPKKVPAAVNFIITALICILTVYGAVSIKPSKGIVILLSTFLSYGVLATFLLAFFDIWISMAHPFLAIFLCYYFFIPYRLIIENRRSWEYYQKNKLLHEVEELKSNFISMMSHDLKTPIARIQGMTEVILQEPIPLTSVQREAVDTIKSSSDDLLKFINSILQYGRIESQGIELHKRSKDINQLLQDVIKKHEFLAKIKKIKIITELDPLFPILIDADLMRQVFSNLIENAIKYSLEEALVIVKSREIDDHILVDVIDNGLGIPATDLPHIFMKFYRSQNVKTSTIKGTGLGLYLAHYFVKLHKGELSVTSEDKKGSTFTVKLPLSP